MRFIPRPVHGVLDYLTGLLFIATPWIFGYAQERPVAADLAMILGAAIVVYTALTNFEVGVVRLIPFPAHLLLDVVMAIALIGAPIHFAVGGVAGVVFVVFGILELGTALFTRGEGRPSGKPGFPTWS